MKVLTAIFARGGILDTSHTKTSTLSFSAWRGGLGRKSVRGVCLGRREGGITTEVTPRLGPVREGLDLPRATRTPEDVTSARVPYPSSPP